MNPQERLKPAILGQGPSWFIHSGWGGGAVDGIPTVGGGSFPREGGNWGTALNIDPPNSPEQCPSSAEHLAPPRRRASRPAPAPRERATRGHRRCWPLPDRLSVLTGADLPQGSRLSPAWPLPESEHTGLGPRNQE